MNEPFIPLSTFGIGSVPYRDGEDRCETIFEGWDIPFWPQYPARSSRENFLFQFLGSFPGLEILKDSARFNETAYLKSAKTFREKLERVVAEETFSSFEPSREWALGYSEMTTLLDKDRFPKKHIVKLQITGPATIWRSFLEKQVSKTNAEQIRQDLCQTLTAVGLAQIQKVVSVGRTPLILIDEPLRSANSLALGGMVKVFKRFGALVGLHDCSSSTWEGLETLGLDLFHFSLASHPSFGFAKRIALHLLIGSNCWIGWGFIPTTSDRNFKAQDFSPLLLGRLQEIRNEQLSIKRILKRSLIAPACGTGMLSVVQDRQVYQSIRLSQEGLRTSFLMA